MGNFSYLMDGFRHHPHHVTTFFIMMVGVMLGHPRRRAARSRCAERRLAALAADVFDGPDLRHHSPCPACIGAPCLVARRPRSSSISPVNPHRLRRHLTATRWRGTARQHARLRLPSCQQVSGRWPASMMITLLSAWVAGFALQFSSPEFFAVYFLAFASFIGMSGQCTGQDPCHDDAGLCPCHRRHGYDFGRIAPDFRHSGSDQGGLLPCRSHGTFRYWRVAC